MVDGVIMEKALSTSADGELILKLYELRTESVMRQARAWVTGEFWPGHLDEFFEVVQDAGSEKSAWLRQVVSYWEMAASLVLHGSLSGDLFIDCNPEPFFILAKFQPILEEIRERMPTWFQKTSQLIATNTNATARFEVACKTAEAMRARRSVVR